MSASALYPAIKTKFEATTGLSAVGTLYNGLQPEGKAFPYARFFPIPSPKPKYAFGLKYNQTYSIQIDIFATSSVTVGTYQDALHAAFDRGSLTVSGATCLSCIRQNDLIMRQGVNKDGNAIFHAVSRYDITLDKSL